MVTRSLFVDYGRTEAVDGMGTITPFEQVMITAIKTKQGFEMYGCSHLVVG